MTHVKATETIPFNFYTDNIIKNLLDQIEQQCVLAM